MMTHYVQSFRRVPLDPASGYALLAVMCQAININLGRKPLIDQDDYRLRDNGVLNVTFGPTAEKMPCVLVGCNDCNGNTKPLAATLCRHNGLYMRMYEHMSFSRTVSIHLSLHTMAEGTVSLLNKAAETYIEQCFPRFAYGHDGRERPS